MLWLIHDGRSGQCNPYYATIASKAGCAMSTVCEAVKALELAGILSWVNRIVRVRIRECDLFGQWMTTRRVLRTSNAYVFHDPKAAERSKTEIRSGHSRQCDIVIDFDPRRIPLSTGSDRRANFLIPDFWTRNALGHLRG